MRLPVALLLAACLAACRDEAAEAYARARLRYDALVAEGARPADPRFDAVIEALAAVPASSRRHAEAESLRSGIEAGRRAAVRTPLSLASDGHRPPELEAQLAACGRLAAMAGADGGVDRRALEALEACRREAEALELRLSHHDGHGTDDGGAQ